MRTNITTRNAGAEITPSKGPERRVARRYLLSFLVRCRIGVKGAAVERQAWTRDVSTHGLGFEPDDAWTVGEHILMFLNWPVPDRFGAPMNLVATGRVTRSDPSGVGVTFDHRPFFLHRDTRAGSLRFPVPPDWVM